MTTVNVTLTAGITVHYWLQPVANVDLTTGTGVQRPASGIFTGFSVWIDGTTLPQLTWALDPAFKWDIHLTFRGAAPIDFYGFQPGAGGDLLELLSAQGWVQ